MKVNRVLSRAAFVLCGATFVGILSLGAGCSKDEILGDATAEAVEVGLNDVLASTVQPLVTFLGVIPDIVAAGAPARSSFGGGVTCPDTSAVCAGGGSAVCTVSGGGFSLTFQFTDCGIVTGDLPITLNGGLVVTPGITVAIQLNGLVINGSDAMTGSGTVNVVGCSYTIGVTTNDGASVSGTIVQCDSDDFPTVLSHLVVAFDDAVIDITFNGSSVANAVATVDGDAAANCTINLAANPLSSSCEAP